VGLCPPLHQLRRTRPATFPLAALLQLCPPAW
jgi:hypothetical protein